MTSTLSTPATLNDSLPAASARRTISPAATPRGRPATPSTSSLIRMRFNSSPLRTPATPQAILTLSPRATLNLKVADPPPSTIAPGPTGIDAITAAIQAAMGPTIQAAMGPYVAKLDALEKATMPPPLVHPAHRHNPTIPTAPAPTARQEKKGNRKDTEAPAVAPIPSNPTVHRDSGFILVDRQCKKGKGKTSANVVSACGTLRKTA